MHRFKEYETEQLLIDSLWSRMTPVEREFRLAVLDAIIDAGGPVGPADVAWIAEDHGGASAEELFDAIARKHVLVVSDGLVQFAYPVSALATNHTVHLADGRSFSAMCAIDAMGSALTLGQDTVVEDRCGVCGAPITVRVEAGELASVEPSTAHAIHADLSGTGENWAASC
jgi:hypothetical protein